MLHEFARYDAPERKSVQPRLSARIESTSLSESERVGQGPGVEPADDGSRVLMPIMSLPLLFSSIRTSFVGGLIVWPRRI